MSRAKLVYEATGTTDDGATIVLETPVPVRGRVKVHIESDVLTAERGSSRDDLWAFLERLHAEQRAHGHTPPTPEQVDAYIRNLRSEWRDEENLSR